MPKHALLRCQKCGHNFDDVDDQGICRAPVNMDGLNVPCYCVCEFVAQTLAHQEEEPRAGLLGEVIDRRTQVYGDPEKTFVRIAEIWSGILGVTVNPVDVPLCMIGLKLVRAQVMPDYEDNIADVEGYADIFRKLVGDDMVKVRSVAEFIQQKWGE